MTQRRPPIAQGSRSTTRAGHRAARARAARRRRPAPRPRGRSAGTAPRTPAACRCGLGTSSPGSTAMRQPAASTRCAHSLSSQADSRSSKRNCSHTSARHDEAWLEKPQYGWRRRVLGVLQQDAVQRPPVGPVHGSRGSRRRRRCCVVARGARSTQSRARQRAVGGERDVDVAGGGGRAGVQRAAEGEAARARARSRGRRRGVRRSSAPSVDPESTTTISTRHASGRAATRSARSSGVAFVERADDDADLGHRRAAYDRPRADVVVPFAGTAPSSSTPSRAHRPR